MGRISRGEFNHVFLFSHGWNNDWPTATKRYEHFLEGFQQMRKDYGLNVPQPWRPVMVGIFWPSAVLVGAHEEAPQIAGDPDLLVAEERQEIAELAEVLDDRDVPRFYELVQEGELDHDQAYEFARLVRSLYRTNADEIAGEIPFAEDIVGAWVATVEDEGGSASADDEDPFTFGTVNASGTTSTLAAAGLMSKLRPRDIVRMLTVWQMKDRAGVVGARGVAPLLVDILQSDKQARVHLVGHSFGAKVVMSAACYPPVLPRTIRSILLLQPAVSHLCFADHVPGSDSPGGYQDAPRRVELPILSTYSTHDFPLTRTFHLALRRRDDRGDQRIAATDQAPSVDAALGGFGPGGLGPRAVSTPVRVVGKHYNLSTDGPEVIGVDASATISGHGDISNTSTWWALYDLITA
jgi:hypothetical protein